MYTQIAEQWKDLWRRVYIALVSISNVRRRRRQLNASVALQSLLVNNQPRALLFRQLPATRFLGKALRYCDAAPTASAVVAGVDTGGDLSACAPSFPAAGRQGTPRCLPLSPILSGPPLRTVTSARACRGTAPLGYPSSHEGAL